MLGLKHWSLQKHEKTQQKCPSVGPGASKTQANSIEMLGLRHWSLQEHEKTRLKCWGLAPGAGIRLRGELKDPEWASNTIERGAEPLEGGAKTRKINR